MGEEGNRFWLGGGRSPRAKPEPGELPEQAQGEARGLARRVSPVERLFKDWEKLRALPQRFEEIDLATAGARDFEFQGNYVQVLKLSGGSPEIRIRFDSESALQIKVSAECVLVQAYDRIYLAWDAVAGGEAHILFGTSLP